MRTIYKDRTEVMNVSGEIAIEYSDGRREVRPASKKEKPTLTFVGIAEAEAEGVNTNMDELQEFQEDVVGIWDSGCRKTVAANGSRSSWTRSKDSDMKWSTLPRGRSSSLEIKECSQPGGSGIFQSSCMGMRCQVVRC